MNVRERISRLETLLQRIQSHARSRRSAKPPAAVAAVPAAVTKESFPSEPPTGTLEVVEAAPLESIEADDIVEMPSDVLESVPPSAVEPVQSSPPMAAAPVPTGFDEDALADTFEDEEPPASSKRPRIQETIDHAVAEAAREPVFLEEGREVPLKTPPPESGPQEAPPPAAALAAPPTPDFDQLLDDLPPLSHEGLRTGPSPEQLGETIELEAPVGPPIELEREPAFTSPQVFTEELEVTLPFNKSAGNYDEGLVPPPEAREELEEHRRRSGEHVSIRETGLRASDLIVASPPELAPAPEQPESTTVPAADFEKASTSRDEASHVVQRSSLAGLSPVEFTGASARAQTPATFLMLLDESLRLGEE